MDTLSARSSYLNDIEGVMTRCSSKLESLVTSIGWTMDSLTKKTQDDDFDEDERLQDDSVEEKPEAPVAETKDFEKLYNDLIAGLPNQQKKSQEKSEAELLVDLLELERNMKRRRISYKNKVHTKNKSHTEVLRALVREQMDVLKDIAGSDANDEGGECNKPDSKEPEDDSGLIQLGHPRGNPYTIWQKIGQVLESRNGNDSESRIPPLREDSSRSRSNLKTTDSERRTDRLRHSSDSRPPGSSRRFKNEHDDRYHRSSSRSERDFISDRSKHDKRKRRSPDLSYEHRRRPHQKSSYS
ncbi:hypothetical protein GE061_002501 [Apolygus lucorum]|uniref:Uncharacterized protein n=1 Tax=Apolygus lucorum TaxID=248454 RepID=A0A6A4JES7_APOLU|nr:hypothetical protein GE061_002501 [Apolygus lucorum]